MMPYSYRVVRDLWTRLLAVTCLTVLIGVSRIHAGSPVEPDRAAPFRGCGKAHALAQKFRAERMHARWQEEYDALRRAGLREALEDTDLLHCDLEIEILPGIYDNTAGTNTMTIQSKSDSLNQFTFRLRNQYSIDDIYVNGAAPVSVSTPSTTTRVVTLDRTYTMDEVFTLTVVYSGHAESRGFGSIQFTSHGGADIVYTLSEPYFSYTWWPCKDGDYAAAGDNGDKFTLDLALIAPDSMVTASNGALMGVDPLGGSRARYRWSSNYPICAYLVCFSSTNYDTWSVDYYPTTGGTMPVLFYIYPEHNSPYNRSQWEKAVDMLYTLRDLYGEYPFVDDKYGIYECQFGGGMEHQTFTAQGTFLEFVTVHELGHQWWGDMVTCKTWNHIWLNEGFASYTEALWEEFKPGSSGHPALMSVMNSKRYTGGGSVYVTDGELGSIGDIFDPYTTYDKAAWVVHMMRHVLGDQEFFDALAAYRAAFQFSAATTEDFQAICEQFYGDSLDWFFQEWVYGSRTPEYTWGWDSVEVNGNPYLLVSIDQTQSESYQRFTMPIDIAADANTYVVFNDADPEHFVIPVPAAPASVDLDPGAWVLRTRVSSNYVPGPPKIVETSPAPGDTPETSDVIDTVTVWFHTTVNTQASDFSLVGDNNGEQPSTLASGSNVNPAVLNLDAPLAADTYTLTVADNVTAVDSGMNLDGEVPDPTDVASLPSGDGEPGGDAVIRFTVTASLLGDLDGDGDVDLTDFVTFAGCFGGAGVTTPPGGCDPTDFAGSDLDDDNDVDLADFISFSGNFTG